MLHSFEEIKEFFQKHGSKILTCVCIGLILAGAGLWLWNSRAKARLERSGMLQELIIKYGLLQRGAVAQARLGPESGESMPEQSYNTAGLARSFSELAQKELGKPLGMTALLQKAEAIRSELYFANIEFSKQERLELCDRAEKVYQQVLRDYPKRPIGVGMARIGVGLLAEERRQWDQAKQSYETIIAEKETLFAGTIFPLQAQQRLSLLEDIQSPIVFPPAPMETISAEKVFGVPEPIPTPPVQEKTE